GLVPTAGVIPLAWSLDHVGVFTREVADAAAAFAVLTRRSVAAEPCGPPRLALAPELLRRASREVAAHVQATADAFARAGATITEVKLPGSFDGIHAVGQTVLGSEAAASHEPRFAKHADQYGPEIRRLVEAGLTISAVTYLGANRARLAFREEVLELLAAHDGLLSPTAPAPAPEGLASTGDASLCAPWSFAGSRADVGIRDDVIVAVGDLSGESAGSSLWAAGRALAPGFIDMHSHSDWRLWENRRAESKIRQGVTTEVVGNCGFSPAPASREFLQELRGFALYLPRGMDFRWQSVGEYLKAFDAEGTALNVMQLVGHGTLRIAAMGFARRAPDRKELARMQRLMADAMEDGAWGL